MQAYVLHTRKYTDSRYLVDFLTLDSGRVAAVVRTQKKQTSLLQPFQVLDIEWKGRGDLKTVTQCETDGLQPHLLKGSLLYCGFYLNELLQRLLPLDEENKQVYECYEAALGSLTDMSSVSEVEPTLREFEFSLLNCLGFGVRFTETIRDQPVEGSQSYIFLANKGLCEFDTRFEGVGAIPVSGQTLLAIAKADYSLLETRKSAKAIARVALARLLGARPLKSREFF